MKPAEVLSRARSAISKGCIYGMGKGGFHPDDPLPFGPDYLCDCSGFAMWGIHLPRHYAGIWFDTHRIDVDALTEGGLFDKVSLLEARPSDLFVYGDAGGHQGHIGIISEVTPGIGPTKAIHCSHGNYVKALDAIQETGTSVWARRTDAIVARCNLITG